MENNQNWQTEFYRQLAQKSPQIIKNFKYVYGAILGVLILGGYFIFTSHPLSITFMTTIGKNLGRVALVLLGIVVLPGILGRFQIEIPITRIITLFRRQLGITVFLLAFTHYQLVRGILILSVQIPLFPRPLFEMLGTLSLFLLFFMFLTSNNFSVKKLGRWWKRLHRIVYLIIWLLVLHTGLQRISVWSIFIFIFATAEIVSWVYFFIRQKVSSA